MLKKVLCLLLVTLVSGAMLTVDVADAARRSRAVRLRPSSKTVTQQPARTTTSSTTAQTQSSAAATSSSSAATTRTTTTPSTSSTAAQTAPAATTTTSAPAATAAPTAQTAYGQRTAMPGQTAAPAAQSQGSGLGGTLLGAGAGLVGGYMLGSALSGPDAAAAAAPGDAATAAPAGAEGAQPLPAQAQPAAPAVAPSPVAALLGYDTASYCTQLSQGDAGLLQQCTAAEAEAAAAFRSCVAMSSGLNGIGSYEVLLRCLRAAPATR